MEIQITDRKVRLGVGGYGSVFPGTYRGIKVAVKRVELIKDDDNVASDREANILKQLDHPNTVKLYHFETDDNFK
jgi:serine/threonine protein kinase